MCVDFTSYFPTQMQKLEREISNRNYLFPAAR